MDLILISEEKLKIILTYQDMIELNIDIESLDYSNVSTKKAFWEILDKAKESAGFDADKSKLYVQVFPCSDGGCEMFVTKYNSSNNFIDSERKYTYKTVSKKSTTSKFIVSNYDSFSKLCKRLYKEKNYLKADLYKTEQEEYILTLEVSEILPSYHQSRQQKAYQYPEYLSEYGKLLKLTETIKTQIAEYCALIIKDNAIEMLASLSD